MNIQCVMVIHDLQKRRRIIKATVKRLQGQGVGVLIVGDRKSHGNLAKQLNCAYAEGPDKPLSNKWQTGMDAVRELDPGAVLICGSDDWLSPNWVPVAHKALEQGLDLER